MKNIPSAVLAVAPSNHFYGHRFSDLISAPFDVNDYSRLKFGSEIVARAFGRELADAFFDKHRDLLATQQCVVIPAPSTTVPVAATLMGHHFRNRLNEHLDVSGLGPVEWTMIHRNMAYNHNYACLGKEERKAILSNDARFMANSYVADKHLLFIDDVTITGTHEEEIVHFLWREQLPNRHTFVAFAKYMGDDPSIETRLNHVCIKDARDLVKLSREPGHRLTTRAVRLFLDTSLAEFLELLEIAPDTLLEDAYHAAIVKGYNRDYPDTFAALRRKMGRV